MLCIPCKTLFALADLQWGKQVCACITCHRSLLGASPRLRPNYISWWVVTRRSLRPNERLPSPEYLYTNCQGCFNNHGPWPPLLAHDLRPPQQVLSIWSNKKNSKHSAPAKPFISFYTRHWTGSTSSKGKIPERADDLAYTNVQKTTTSRSKKYIKNKRHEPIRNKSFEVGSLAWDLHLKSCSELSNNLKQLLEPLTSTFSWNRLLGTCTLNSLLETLVGTSCWNLHLKLFSRTFACNILLFATSVPLNLCGTFYWNPLPFCWIIGNLFLFISKPIVGTSDLFCNPSTGTFNLSWNPSTGTLNLCWNGLLEPSTFIGTFCQDLHLKPSRTRQIIRNLWRWFTKKHNLKTVR